METHVHLAIVGAGAAGLATAIFAAESPARPASIALLDGARSIGAKILVSGGGRCNVTHHEVTALDFFGNRRIIKNVLAAFPAARTIAWFDSLGVSLSREETGKLFPATGRARTVLDALLARCRTLKVEILVDHRVTGIARPSKGGRFSVRHSKGFLTAERVVLATGGRSLPRSGSDGSGYDLAERLGHRVTETSPALVPLVLTEGFFHAELSGLSHAVELTTIVGGRMVDRRMGSLLWTHFGISGPVVMDASRFWTMATRRNETADLFANFFPGFDEDRLSRWLDAQAERTPRKTLVKTLAQSVPERLAERLCSHLGCDPALAVAQCPRRIRGKMVGALSKFRLPVERDRGWNHAEVTAGGVPLEEIDFRTMESRLVPGLYVVGELLDCDGRIGGFNFQWAWATGHLAGSAAARRNGNCAEQHIE
ncbi:MAG TPA: NAD(P)/FAD-dependent oxidoreductase [Nitrospira sp.]|nr:NAD(P)/FAD-dependent oxidoreductase [Nitrospira sp.]